MMPVHPVVVLVIHPGFSDGVFIAEIFFATAGVITTVPGSAKAIWGFPLEGKR